MGVAGFTGPEVRKARTAGGATLPVLWLVGAADDATEYGDLRATPYPVSLDVLASFIATFDGVATARAA